MDLRQEVKRKLPDWLAEPLHGALLDLRDAREWRAYRRQPVVPPPHVVKARTVLGYARRFRLRVLIETGTFEGEMVRKCQGAFREIYTIELDPDYARRAQRRFARLPNVHVMEGDSTRRLPELLSAVREPALFWLDGHYSGSGTALGEKETPLLEELDAIRRHGIQDHVILIDDVRCFGEGDYPDLETITRALRAIRNDYCLEIAADILRCAPPAGV